MQLSFSVALSCRVHHLAALPRIRLQKGVKTRENLS
jgi:hypothetical protein